MNKLVAEDRRSILKSWAMNERYSSDPAPIQLAHKHDLYRHAVEVLGAQEPITYLEFGVAEGDSIRFFAEHFTSASSEFIGFDSFEGLPEPWLHMPRFSFGRNGHEPENADQRVRYIKGWFQNTLQPFLSNWRKPTNNVLIHYDADLYGSTLFSLSLIWPMISSYYFIMDDFQFDDSVALFDFESAFPIKIEFLAQAGKTSLGTLVPDKVLGKIANITFEPKS